MPTPRSSLRPAQRPGRLVQFTLLDTPLGAAALAWSDQGLAGVILPGEASARAAASRWPGARPADPPAWVRALGRRLVEHLDGRLDPLTDVVLDLDPDASPFDRAVWSAAREVAPGSVATYGDLARAVGKPGAARAVGGAMGRNPVPFVIPCHRIVAAGGRIGGFSSPRGLKTKRALLAAEGVELSAAR